MNLPENAAEQARQRRRGQRIQKTGGPAIEGSTVTQIREEIEQVSDESARKTLMMMLDELGGSQKASAGNQGQGQGGR